MSPIKTPNTNATQVKWVSSIDRKQEQTQMKSVCLETELPALEVVRVALLAQLEVLRVS